jgi:hypothetical protein
VGGCGGDRHGGEAAMDTDEVAQLAQEFAIIGKELHGTANNQAALQRIVQLTVKHVDACAGASITVVRGKSGHSPAASDPAAAAADALQFELREGPFYESERADAPFMLFDVEGESQWPRSSAALIERTSYRSVLSFRLIAEDCAALNLFAEQPGGFVGADVDLAAVLAAHASSLVALYEAEGRVANLETALESNREIGAATGVLMALHKVTPEDAFTLLRAASQRLHRKLRDVAAEVVETGALPAHVRRGKDSVGDRPAAAPIKRELQPVIDNYAAHERVEVHR